MSIRLSRPNTRTFLSYSADRKLTFGSDPSETIFFESLSESTGVAFRVVKIGQDEIQIDTFLRVNDDGELYLGNLPQFFSNVPLNTVQRFYLGREEVFIVDDTPWTQANSGLWKNLLIILLILIIAGVLAYLGRHNARRDLGYLFYSD